jgi:ABC-type transporter Mla subunit MlaD
MPTAQKTTKKATPAARARQEDNAAALDRVTEALESAQKALSSVRGNVGTGASDLRRDVTRLIRDARRDVRKMNRAVLRDLERFQKELTGTPGRKPAATRRAGAPSRSGGKAPRSRRPS